MGIERKVEEKWTCDGCGKEITDRKTAIVLDVLIRGRIPARTQYVFCNDECANTWWGKSTKEKIVE